VGRRISRIASSAAFRPFRVPKVFPVEPANRRHVSRKSLKNIFFCRPQDAATRIPWLLQRPEDVSNKIVASWREDA
jgi:hypothetical protein